MMNRLMCFFIGLLCLSFAFTEAKLPDIQPQDVTAKAKEIMKAHASYKKLSPTLVQRILNNYLEQLDPNKTYFIESDLGEWINPSEESLNKILSDYEESRFEAFEKMHAAFLKAVERRHLIEQKIDYSDLPSHIKPDEFKDLPWAKNEEELLTRLKRIKALQIETATKLNDEMKEKSLQRITKRQAKYEEEMSVTNAKEKQQLISSLILKATASALDTHTVYFIPDEAEQFMISVQQRLFGIGAQLRDDINGFTVVKVVDGGPAAQSKELNVRDRIVAVNGEPVVGMDIADAVELIRGEKNTPVLLTVIREETTPEGEKTERKLDVSILRGEVVLKETRYKTSYEPFGDGVIGYLKLYSFYQDQDSSSASDLEKEIEKLKENHHLNGLVLDLRYNSGGLLSQAVAVTGLFIKKGVVVSIKDENGRIQHIRDLDGVMAWDGPLIVLVNRASASASEIVAQTLQDYGRAVIVGDDRTYGKGSYQTFTLNVETENVNPQGEYKVTRGRYYTVSGKTPQLTGVLSDVTIAGPLSETDIGERFVKYPLDNDHIKANFEDDLSDIPYLQREKIRKLYRFGLQEKLETYTPYIVRLQENSQKRIEHNKNYQNLLKELKKDVIDPQQMENFGQNDLQLEESYNVMKDLIAMMQDKGLPLPTNPKKKERLTSSPSSQTQSLQSNYRPQVAPIK